MITDLFPCPYCGLQVPGGWHSTFECDAEYLDDDDDGYEL